MRRLWYWERALLHQRPGPGTRRHIGEACNAGASWAGIRRNAGAAGGSPHAACHTRMCPRATCHMCHVPHARASLSVRPPARGVRCRPWPSPSSSPAPTAARSSFERRSRRARRRNGEGRCHGSGQHPPSATRARETRPRVCTDECTRRMRVLCAHAAMAWAAPQLQVWQRGRRGARRPATSHGGGRSGIDGAPRRRRRTARKPFARQVARRRRRGQRFASSDDTCRSTPCMGPPRSAGS